MYITNVCKIEPQNIILMQQVNKFGVNRKKTFVHNINMIYLAVNMMVVLILTRQILLVGIHHSFQRIYRFAIYVNIVQGTHITVPTKVIMIVIYY